MDQLQQVLVKLIRRWPKMAVPAHVLALFGRKQSQPDGLPHSLLEDALRPQAVEALLEMSGDSLAEVRDVAVEGLMSLASDAQLVKGISSRKKQARESAARAPTQRRVAMHVCSVWTVDGPPSSLRCAF